MALGAVTGLAGESTPTESYTDAGTDASDAMSDPDAGLNVSTVEVLLGEKLSRTMTSVPSKMMATTINPSAR